MKEFAELSYNIIRYIEEKSISEAVGLGDNKPPTKYLKDAGHIDTELTYQVYADHFVNPFKHKNPLCRVVPVLTKEKEEVVRSYDKEKYRDLLLDAAETVLGYFGFDGSVYRKSKNRERSSKQKKWWGRIERGDKKRY